MCVLLCVGLCSCADSGIFYEPQDHISFNYNNISTGNTAYWIDTDAVYYQQHDLLFNVYMIKEDGQRKLTSAAGVGELQVYNGKLYFLDLEKDTEKFVLCEYDVNAGKKKEVVAFEAETVLGYYLLENRMYVVTRGNGELKENVKVVLLETNAVEDVASDTFACGVFDGKFAYVAATDGVYNAYQYDGLNNETTLIGSFEISLGVSETLCDAVSFTSDAILFAVNDEANMRSRLLVYNISDALLEEYAVNGYVNNAVAYNEYAFVSVTEKLYSDSNLQNNKVYRFCIESFEYSEIAELDGILSMFMTSDDDVYISSTAFEGIVHYSSGGEKEDVLRYE